MTSSSVNVNVTTQRHFFELDSSSTCSIFRNLRRPIGQPKLMGFGLYHHDDCNMEIRDFNSPQDRKQAALDHILATHFNSMQLNDLFMRIGSSVEKIRSYYEKDDEIIECVSQEGTVIRKFVLDACCIVDFFTSLGQDDYSRRKHLRDDLFRLENQIPLYFLLNLTELLHCRNPNETVAVKFAKLLTNYQPFQTLLPFEMPEGRITECLKELLDDRSDECHHLLDLLCRSIHKFLSGKKQPSSTGGPVQPSSICGTRPPATCPDLSELHEYNIKFKAGSQVMFQRRWRPLSSILHLPPIDLDSDTVNILSNIMEFAYRKKVNRGEKLICDFMFLLKCIVRARNEDLLSREGIIKGVSTIPGEISNRIVRHCEDFSDDAGQYQQIITDLRRHCQSAPNRWISVFYKNLVWWSIMGVVLTIFFELLDRFQK